MALNWPLAKDIATAAIAAYGALLSTRNWIASRDRYKAEICVNHIEAKTTGYLMEVRIANVGNRPFSVRSIVVYQDFDALHNRKAKGRWRRWKKQAIDDELKLYDLMKDDVESRVLSPGEVLVAPQRFRVHVFSPHTIVVTSHVGHKWRHTVRWGTWVRAPELAERAATLALSNRAPD